MLSDISLGQFFPGKSVIHRMDPRVKIILSIVFIVAIFLCRHVLTFALITLFALLLLLVSGISVRTILTGLRPIVFVLLLTAVVNILMTDGQGEPLLAFHFVEIYEEGLWRALLMSVRVILLILVGSLFLTYTTSPIALTDAIESLLTPLKWIHVPVHEFAMMMSIALRFIPTLLEETEKIMNAQKSRGADLSSGNPFKRIKALIPVIVPLFVSAFQRAMDLATAMECRCYRGGNGRTKLREYHIGIRDIVVTFMHAALVAGIVLGNIYFPVILNGWGYMM